MLSYCRGTARCTMLVNSCYVSRGMGVIKSPNSKSDDQGHWQWHHSTGHIRLPITILMQLCLYLAPFLRYCHLFPKYKIQQVVKEFGQKAASQVGFSRRQCSVTLTHLKHCMHLPQFRRCLY